MRTAFHITKSKNLYSILQDGLKINSGISGICSKVQCSRYDEYYGCQPIFVTTDISACARRYLTKEFIEMEDCVCLEVDIFDFKVEYEYQYVINNWEKFYNTKELMEKSIFSKPWFAYVIKENIPPEKLRLFLGNLLEFVQLDSGNCG